ncbi:MAG: hypothetical protein GF375_04095 [Candidatus Omnitrophica bacterium]|nr:hypothetical protein [Candidatus Omnitrophota bacterium]
MGAIAYPKLQQIFIGGAPPGTSDVDITIAATDYDAGALSPYRAKTISATSAHDFTFFVPDSFPGLSKLNALELLYINVSANVGVTVQIDFASEYGLDTQAKNANFVNHPDPAGGAGSYLISAVNTHGKFDLTNLAGTNMFPNLAAGQRCGLNVNHRGIGGGIGYLGIRIAYNY